MKVYLIGNGQGFYKIGYTGRSIKKRLEELQVGSAYTLREVSSYESDDAPRLETILHNIHSHCRREGEWFELDEAEVSRFAEMAEKAERNLRVLRDSGNAFI